MARQAENERARLVHVGMKTFQSRLLPCGHTLVSTAVQGPRAQEVHNYRLQRDETRHECILVNHTNPNGLRDKRAGE